MGVVNVTPDSFSDGGRYLDPGRGVAHGARARGGGGGDPRRRRRVDAAWRRAGDGGRGAPARPAGDRGARALGVRAQLSIDTSKAAVAAAALRAGATLVNDVTALRGDPEMAGVVAASGADCCLMHMLGEPRTMQRDPRYDDVVSEVKGFLEERMAFAIAAGRRRGADPARPRDRLRQDGRPTTSSCCARLDEIVALGRPVLIGTSRKSFLGRLTGRATVDRLAATIATNVLAYERGAAHFPGPRGRRRSTTRSRWLLLRSGRDGPETSRTSSTTSTKA